ncbi:MAG: hypothetical protein U9O98_00935, partial [Asgard group archaeon]|nr:hypothetical protein [Asgard group archaeon]
TVSISEEIGIDTVTVTISGNSISDYYEMTLNPNATVGTIYEYYTEIDFSNYAQDNYTLTFVITDLAGNTIQNEYIITVLLDTTQTTPPPAPTPPSNIVTYLFGAIGGIIVLIVVAFLILRKPIANIGWKESLKAVSYIMKNGQTAMYVPYTTQFLKEDQLFGGGMTGILSVLEEITGEKEVYKEVQTVEYGNSYLLIYPSTYGTGIAMVSEKKPKHEDVIENFTIDFENTYRKAIARDFIFEPDFQDARKLAEKYFGESPCKEGESELVYETDMSHTEESSPREKIQAEDLQEHIKADIGKAIKQTQQALTALIDGDLDSSESHANQTLVLLEKILNGTTKLTSQKQSIEYLPRIIEKIFEGIKAARNNDIVKYQQSVEEASQLFFDSIN